MKFESVEWSYTCNQITQLTAQLLEFCSEILILIIQSKLHHFLIFKFHHACAT